MIDFTYICGTIVETDGDQSGFLAKFDDLGQRVWEEILHSTKPESEES